MKEHLKSVKLWLLAFAVIGIFPAPPAWSEEEFFDYGDPETVADFSFYTPPADATPYKKREQGLFKTTNVILLIGDGMGMEQIELARMMASSKAGALHLEKLPLRAKLTTDSMSGVTDSAAAGTALASGIKTKNKVIGLNPAGVPYTTILEASKSIGKRTGLVATSTISHATPASFASHVTSRKDETKIAVQLFENRVNVLLGGGMKYWQPVSIKDDQVGNGRNLLQEARQAGYVIVHDTNTLSQAEGEYVLGLFQKEAMQTSGDEPSLPQMTHEALRILGAKNDSKRKGFFLMVEGSQIDWGNHANNANNLVKQTLLFDLAVKEAMDFAIADNNTLVLVTADHETGGLLVEEGLPGKPAVTWKTKRHTSTQVPLFAFGPGAEAFNDVKDNTDVPKRIAMLFGINEFPRAKQ